MAIERRPYTIGYTEIGPRPWRHLLSDPGVLVGMLSRPGSLLLLAACAGEYDLSKEADPAEQAQPRIEVSPRELHFPDLLPDQTDALSVSIRNLGEAPLRILTLSLEQPEGAFALIDAPAGLDLEPGGEEEVTVVYTAGGGDAADTLHVASNDPSTPDVPVTLLGGSELPALELDPVLYDFGPQVPGCEVHGLVTARSVGSAPVTLESVAIGGDFGLEPSDLPRTLEPGEEHPIEFVYLPQVGESVSSLSAFSDAANGTRTAEVVGLGVPPDPVVDLFETFILAKEPVYLHDSYDYYSYDPDVGTVDFIGTSPVPLYDCAIDKDGYLIGLGSYELTRVDPTTGLSTSWLPISISGNALTVLPDNRIIAAAGSTVYEIDRKTGATVPVYTSASGTSSGDLSAFGGMIYWTVSGGDRLIEIDPASWTGTDIGSTGVGGLWGLAGPDDELWGFGSDGSAYLLDPATAAVLDTVPIGVSAYGAAHNPRYGEPEEYSFELSQTPIEESLAVWIDGVPSEDWLYLVDDNAVFFPEGRIEGGEEVEVHYEVLPECG